MNTSIHHHGFRDQALVWTLLLSFCLHVLAMVWLPKFESEPADPLLLLTVELAPPAPVPAPIVAPEPQPEPEPPKPEPKIEPKVLPKPVVKREPAPIVEPPPSTSPTEPEITPEPPAVISVEPQPEAPPVFVAPPPEPPEPIAPSQQDVDDARSQYGNQLARAIARHKQYPKIARMRGWQGEAEIDLQLDGNGNMLSSRIATSSGFEVLDKQALEMVKKAAPFPAPPEALRGSTFNILVPVGFRLE